MKREYRLNRNSSFHYIYRNGEKIYNRYFVLYFVKGKSTKIGISVSKKIGNSVVRNKVKRRLKEAFSQLIEGIKGRYNFVIVARESIVNVLFSDIRNELIKVLEKEKLYEKVM